MMLLKLGYLHNCYKNLDELTHDTLRIHPSVQSSHSIIETLTAGANVSLP